MKTSFKTILATTAIMALNVQAMNTDEIETNPFYKLAYNRLAQKWNIRSNNFAEADAEADSCLEAEATVNLYQGEGDHIAKKSDRWRGPGLAQIEVDAPTCGSTFDRRSAT